MNQLNYVINRLKFKDLSVTLRYNREDDLWIGVTLQNQLNDLPFYTAIKFLLITFGLQVKKLGIPAILFQQFCMCTRFEKCALV